MPKSQQGVNPQTNPTLLAVLLATFATSRANSHPDAWFFWMLLGAGALNLVAIVAFLESYVGFRHGVEVHVGPSLTWIQAKAQDRTWTVPSHYLSLLSADDLFHVGPVCATLRVLYGSWRQYQHPCITDVIRAVMEPIAFRLSPQMAAKLDHLIKEGKFKDRSEAIRAGLALLDYVDSEEHDGRMVVSVPKSDLKKFTIARPVPG